MKVHEKLELTIIMRGGKVSLWLGSEGERWSIWDLESHEATPNVLNAIRSAVERGALLMRKQMDQVYLYCDKWEIEDD
jgi:hypothetical protein